MSTPTERAALVIKRRCWDAESIPNNVASESLAAAGLDCPVCEAKQKAQAALDAYEALSRG